MSRVAAASLCPVLGHQVAERGRADQRGVAGQHDDVAVVEVVVGEGGERHRQGVARAPGDLLLDEVDEQVGRAVLLQGLGDRLGPVAHHHDRPVDEELGQGVEDVEEHRPPAQRMERLGQRRPHPGALPAAITTADSGRSFMPQFYPEWGPLGGQDSNLDLGSKGPSAAVTPPPTGHSTVPGGHRRRPPRPRRPSTPARDPQVEVGAPPYVTDRHPW